MKNYNLIIFFISALLLTNCSVELTQPGRFDADSAFQSVDDLNLGLLGAYNELDITDQITFNATFTDEISIGFDSGGQGVGDGRYLFILNSNSAISGQVWTDAYDAINASTRLIEASALITPESGEQDFYNSIVGQAHAIRAWAHFQLFSYYSTDYTDGSSPCVIAVDFVPELDLELGRNTVGEVAALIKDDLQSASTLMSNDTSDPTFMNKDFVTALSARLALYQEDYGMAASLAQQLSDKYPLANQDQYFDMYDDLDNTEVIFKLQRNMGDSYDSQATGGGGWAGALFAFVDATITGSPYFEMSRSLYNCFLTNDVRRSRNIDPSSVINNNYANDPDPINSDILVIRKYPGSDGQPLMNDLKIFRTSEMYLIQAEAAVANGDLSGAAGFIQSIRDARTDGAASAPSYGSATEAWADILKERRIELCFEAHRYLDLKRLAQKASVFIDRDPIDCEPYGACSIANDDHRWTLPIPQAELNANSVIREQQNPGY